MRRPIHWISGLFAALLATAAPVGVAGADAAAHQKQQEQRQQEQLQQKQQWVQRYQDLRSKHARLEKDLTQARADYSRGRSSRHPRGDGKAALIAEIDRLEKEFDQADQELRNFPESAQRQGALPGWFRDLDERPGAQAGSQPAAMGRHGEDAAARDEEPSRSSKRSQAREKERSSRRLPRK